MRVAGIVFCVLLGCCVATLPPGPVTAVARADDFGDDDADDDGSRGEGEMLREQQHERNRDELDAAGDRSERNQDREERIEDRREERENEKEEGSGGIKEFFGE